MQLPSRPLRLEHGPLGKAHEELKWYFTEGRAAQSGLRSNQGMLEARMEACGASLPRRPSGFDERLIRHISRARRIERTLAAIPNRWSCILVEVHDPVHDHHLRVFGIASGIAHRTATAKAMDQLDLMRLGQRLLSPGGDKRRKDRNVARRIEQQAEMIYAEALAEYERER